MKEKKKQFSHVDSKGKANMVDVSEKAVQHREAVAEGFISLSDEALSLIKENQNKKGDVLTVAVIAGIQAAKQTAQLIPLCHPLQLTKVDVVPALEKNGIRVTCRAVCCEKTGVEMEALTGVSVALLTVYDMCKAVDKSMKIQDIKLVSKTKK